MSAPCPLGGLILVNFYPHRYRDQREVDAIPAAIARTAAGVTCRRGAGGPAMSEAGIYRRAGPRLHDAAINCCARSAVKSLTPAERARRAGVLGIVLPGPPGPDAPPPPPAPRRSGTARPPIAGKLAAPAALRAKLGLPVAEPLPAPEPEPELAAPSTAPPPVDRPSGQD